MDNLVQFEEDFNSRTKKWVVVWWDGVGLGGYLRPDQFLDHLTVITSSQNSIDAIADTFLIKKMCLSNCKYCMMMLNYSLTATGNIRTSWHRQYTS